MSEQKRIAANSPANSRWLLLALGFVDAHQVQGFTLEPDEREFRIVVASFMDAVSQCWATLAA